MVANAKENEELDAYGSTAASLFIQCHVSAKKKSNILVSVVAAESMVAEAAL